MHVTAEPQDVEPLTCEEWRTWLAEHADDGHGVWLVLHKDGAATLDYEAAVEQAVAFGWIDSKANKLDERRYRIWFAPRKPHSGWAQSNKVRVERLSASGQMSERGLAVVAAAKADGSWDALDAVLSLEVPPDLAEKLQAVPEAKANFDAFPPSAKRAILEWIAQTKNPDTRAKRIDETADLAARNVRAHQWRPPTK